MSFRNLLFTTFACTLFLFADSGDLQAQFRESFQSVAFRFSSGRDIQVNALAIERLIPQTSETRWEVNLSIINRRRQLGSFRIQRTTVGVPNSTEIIGSVFIGVGTSGLVSNRGRFTDVTAQPNTTYNYRILGVGSSRPSGFLRVTLPELIGAASVDGGTLFAGGRIVLCVQDDRPDFVFPRLREVRGDNSTFIVTRSTGGGRRQNIVAVTDDITSFDFNPLPSAIYLIYNVAFNGAIGGLTVGNSTNNLSGTFDLSNGLIVNALACGNNGRATTGTDRAPQLGDSHVTTFNRPEAARRATLFPNPAVNRINVLTDAAEAGAVIQVYSMTVPGAPLIENRLDEQSVGTRSNLDVSRLRSGNYTAVIRYASGKVEHLNFLKQ